MARGSVGMRNQDGGTRDTGLSWRRGAGQARWEPCQAQELVAVMKRGACDAGRVELRPQQRVARVRGLVRPRERARLRRHPYGPEDTSKDPGRAGAAPHRERPRPRGGTRHRGTVRGTAPQTPSWCRASGPQQRAWAASLRTAELGPGAVAPSGGGCSVPTQSAAGCGDTVPSEQIPE